MNFTGKWFVPLLTHYSSRVMKMLHPSHIWATLPTPGLWTTCSALQGWATAPQRQQGHTGTFCGTGSTAGRVSQFLHSSELSRSQQPHFMQTHREAKARKNMWDVSSLRDWYLTGGKIPTQTKKDLPFWGPALQRWDSGHLSSAHGCLPVLNWGGSACWTHYLGLAFLPLLLSSPIYSVQALASKILMTAAIIAP